MKKRRNKTWTQNLISEVFPGSDLSEEEWRFAVFMAERKRKTGIAFPSWAQVLRWAKEWGMKMTKPEVYDLMHSATAFGPGASVTVSFLTKDADAAKAAVEAIKAALDCKPGKPVWPDKETP